jgi:uncharacterized damage-inducible protein DinB
MASTDERAASERVSRTERLARQLQAEANITDRHLARIPAEQWTWRPHPRSSTMAQLASHLVDCVRFATSIFREDRTDVQLAHWRPYRADGPDAVRHDFADAVEEACAAMRSHPDCEATEPWEMAVDGIVRIRRDRESAFADMTLHHLVHHRAQLSVYLRLLDVPVPPTYGPTADER